MRSTALFCLALAATSCGQKPGQTQAGTPSPKVRPPSLALVVVDTLRRDHLGTYGYTRPTSPGLDAWFSSGQVYDSAYTPIPFTAPAVMSLLSGLYPQHHRVRMVFQRLPADRPVLPEYLKRAGYHTAAVVSNMVLTDEATGLGRRFDYFDDYVDEAVRWSGTRERPAFERTAARTTDAALAWLRQAQKLDRPLFLWVHYQDPHGPYTPPDDLLGSFRHPARQPIDPARVPAYNRLPGLTDGGDFVDRYDGEIAHTDREVTRFLKAWEQQVGLEHSLVVFTADHGETLMEAGRELWFTHGFNVWQEQARVPLMLRGQGLPASRRTEPVSLLDVVPTLLGAAGLPPAKGLDGRSLLDPQPDRELLLEGMGAGRGKQYRALLRAARKWVLYSEGGQEQLAARRLFDLGRDPLEEHPQAWGAEDGQAALEPLFTALRNDPDPSGLPAKESLAVGRRLDQAKVKPDGGLPVVSREVDPATLERLRALGYVQ